MSDYRWVTIREHGRVRHVRVRFPDPTGTAPGGGAGVCACDTPSPTDWLGECRQCGRPVVTFMANPEACRRTWPDLYAHAVRLGVTPDAYRQAEAAAG